MTGSSYTVKVNGYSLATGTASTVTISDNQLVYYYNLYTFCYGSTVLTVTGCTGPTGSIYTCG